MQKQINCSRCKKIVGWLEVFPNNLCIECYKETPESKQEYNNDLFINSINLKNNEISRN